MPNISANCAEDVALRARTIALKEGRSVSNVVEYAVAVFTAMPKDLRDRLLEEYQTNRAEFAGTLSTMRRLLAQQSFSRSQEALVRCGPDFSSLSGLDDDAILAAATDLTRNP